MLFHPPFQHPIILSTEIARDFANIIEEESEAGGTITPSPAPLSPRSFPSEGARYGGGGGGGEARGESPFGQREGRSRGEEERENDLCRLGSEEDLLPRPRSNGEQPPYYPAAARKVLKKLEGRPQLSLSLSLFKDDLA